MRTFLALFLVFRSSCIFACSCLPPASLSKEVLKEYDAVFYGKVISVGECEKGTGVATFLIADLFKGKCEQNVKIHYDCASSCMMDFAVGDEWIIYAKYSQFDVLNAYFCGHSRKRSTGDTPDFYQAGGRAAFDQERQQLESLLGVQMFSVPNDINKQHEEMGARNEQPSGTGKIVLLLISLATMGGVWYFTRKKK